MFALIITLISIALVAALALATLYYGGPIFNLGADRANAAKVAAQGQQIMGAMELYRAEKGVYPNTLADLVSEEYLKSIPVAQAEDARALATALAAPGIWSLSSPGQPVIVLKPVSLATCMAYNKTNLGTSGVLQQARSTHLKQCIGTDVNNLMVVQPKAAADLVFVASNPAAVVQIGPVIATPLPPLSDTTTNGWLNTAAVTPPPPPPPPPPPVLTYTAVYETGGSGPISTVAFPDTTVGESSAGITVTVRNTGTGTLAFSSPSVSVSAPFELVTDTCASTSLSPTASCSFALGFRPTDAQTYSGAGFTASLNATNATLSTISVSGTGLPVPQYSASIAPAVESLYQRTAGDVWKLGSWKVHAPTSTRYFETELAPAAFLTGFQEVIVGFNDLSPQRALFAKNSTGGWSARGSNYYNQLGLPAGDLQYGALSSLTPVPGLQGAEVLVAGSYRTFARFAGNIWKVSGQSSAVPSLGSTGTGFWRDLPDATGADKLVPISTDQAIYLGFPDGSWKAAGPRSLTGASVETATTPVVIPELQGAVKLVTAGYSGGYRFAVMADGTLKVLTYVGGTTFQWLPVIAPVSNVEDAFLTENQLVVKHKNGTWSAMTVVYGVISAGTVQVVPALTGMRTAYVVRGRTSDVNYAYFVFEQADGQHFASRLYTQVPASLPLTPVL